VFAAACFACVWIGIYYGLDSAQLEAKAMERAQKGRRGEAEEEAGPV
jgi:hypothetical protein